MSAGNWRARRHGSGGVTDTRPAVTVNGGAYDAAELNRAIRAEAEAARRQQRPLAPLTALPPTLHDDLAQLNLNARIDTLTLPRSDRPGLGPLINAGKRLCHPLLRWAFLPVFDRVADYLIMLVGYLYRLQDHLEQQAREELPARVARLERRLAGGSTAATVLPPIGATIDGMLDLCHYYRRFVQPRTAEAEALRPYLHGFAETVILGAACGELATGLPGTVRMVERVDGLHTPDGRIEQVNDYQSWLARQPWAEYRQPVHLVIDDWLGAWDAAQLALLTAVRQAPAGSRVTYIGPLPQDPPWPLLWPGRAPSPEIAAFVLASATFRNVTVTRPAGLHRFLVQGDVAEDRARRSTPGA